MTKELDFLIEIGTEELPPKDLLKLRDAFCNSIIKQIDEAKLKYSAFEAFATPRRLALIVKNLETKQQDSTQKRKGPAVAAAFDESGNPKPAAIGFAKSCGVEVSDLDKIDTDKGAWLFFEQKISGKQASEILPEIVQKSLDTLPISKRMRWGSSTQEFVRPVHWVLSLLGEQVVPMELFGAKANNITYGHRFMSNESISINNASEYESKLLESGKVIASYEKRKKIIEQNLIEKGKTSHGETIITPWLLEEVTSLVEHPTVLKAKFKTDFLELPKEVLISSMQDHQRCFAISDNKNSIQSEFLLVSNLESKKPEIIVAGNEKVMHARLADAAFYYKEDQKHKLESHLEQLKNTVYQKQLGTIFDKVCRIKNIADKLSSKIGADKNKVNQAAELAKTDLMTQMVYEFPELQGLTGFYYAKNEGVDNDVAIAIRDHYLPDSATANLPENNIGVCVSIADKIDSLVGMFGINKKPTGDKDPFALRRQALGILRILIENKISLDLKELINIAISEYKNILINKETLKEVFSFFMDRLKNWYQSQGVNPSVFYAVEASNTTNILDFSERMLAIQEFVKLPESKSLAAANKRVKNILEKNVKNSINDDVNSNTLQDKAEKDLLNILNEIENKNIELAKNSEYTKVLLKMASLDKPLEQFFENVMVICENEELKQNRLKLLQKVRNNFLQVADISVL